MPGIIYSDYYLPEDYIHVSEVLKFCRDKQVNNKETIEYFISQSNLNKIFIEKKRNEIEIFELLLEKLFNNTGINPMGISHVFYTKFPYDLMKDNICVPYLLKSKFKMDTATIIGLYQECTTTIQAIQFANALVKSGRSKYVVILSLSYGTKLKDRFVGTSVVGDGAGIMLIGEKDFVFEIVGEISSSDGMYSFNQHNKIEKNIEGFDIIQKGTKLIRELLYMNNLKVDNIELFVPQNLNYIGYYAYSSLMNVTFDKFFLQNIPNGGHLGDVDSIRNYTDVINKHIIRNGAYIVLYAVGTIGSGNDTIYNACVLRRCK